MSKSKLETVIDGIKKLRNEADNAFWSTETCSREEVRALHEEQAYDKVLMMLQDVEDDITSEPSLPVIPQFVADFVEKAKDWTLYEVFDDGYLFNNHDDIAQWLYDNSSNDVNQQKELMLVRALRYGYEIEEEPKYYVVFPNLDNGFTATFMTADGSIAHSDIELSDRSTVGRFTEAEIKAIDKRYWAFAKPVEDTDEEVI